MESKCRSPLHLETTPMFGWSYPEAQTATWMSYDARIPNILQETLKKKNMEMCRKLTRSCRLSSGPQFGLSEDHIRIRETKLVDITANAYSHKKKLETHLSKCVGKLVRHENRCDRSGWSNSLGIDTSETEICVLEAWRRYLQFQYCQNYCNTLLCIRALQGHTGGDLIEPELMGHVAILFNWNNFLFHRGCSFNFQSILDAVLIAGGKERRAGRQTVSTGSLVR